MKKTFPVLYESTEKLNSAGRADEACEQASRAGRRSGAQGLCERMPTSPARTSSKSCTPRILLTKTELGVVAVHRNTSYVHIYVLPKYVNYLRAHTHLRMFFFLTVFLPIAPYRKLWKALRRSWSASALVSITGTDKKERFDVSTHENAAKIGLGQARVLTRSTFNLTTTAQYLPVQQTQTS